MEIASIKGNNVQLLYHPAESAADVGSQFALLELPALKHGLVVQILRNDTLEYAGLQQEMVQQILEQRFDRVSTPMDRELGMGAIKSIKVATAKIRKRISSNCWADWDGWIPTRNVEIRPVSGDEVLNNVIGCGGVRLQPFTTFDNREIGLDGPSLNMTNVITGVKGSGKSHLAKHLVLALCKAQVPCVIFDVNGEYTVLPNAQVLKWGGQGNFLPRLADIGYEILETVVKSLVPLQTGSPSENVFESRLPGMFNSRREWTQAHNRPFDIDIEYLLSQTWSSNDLVQGAIENRLNLVDRMGLFWSNNARSSASRMSEIYDKSCNGRPIVFDMRLTSHGLQKALVGSITKLLETLCDTENNNATYRFPFVFFEEAHFYASPDAMLNIVTRGRHIGIHSVFVTNTPHQLPDAIFRQLDNLFLLPLTHHDDIRHVSKIAFCDEETIESFATRLPERHALIIGTLTNKYPLGVRVEPLPETVPPTGRTRSTWDRFLQDSQAITNRVGEDWDGLPF